MGWSDARARRACEVIEIGCELWGTLGRQSVSQCLALIDTAATLSALVQLAPLGITVNMTAAAPAAAPVLAVRYRSVEVLADPHSPYGPVELTAQGADVRALEIADRLLIHDVRCCGRGTSYGVAA